MGKLTSAGFDLAEGPEKRVACSVGFPLFQIPDI